MTDTTSASGVPDRHDHRLPAHRAPPRTEEGRRGLLGRAAITADELEAHGRRPPRGDPRAARRARPRARRRLHPRELQLLRPGARRGGRPSARCPSRFAALADAHGSVDLAGYFTIARGEGENAPLEMTKWFDSNYHYLVPEIGPETAFRLASDRIVREFEEARAAGFVTRPVIVGPVTFLLLSKPSDEAPEGFRPLSRLADLLPVYRGAARPARRRGRAVGAAGRAGARQREHRRAAGCGARRRARRLRRRSARRADRPAIFVAAPYGSLDDALPVARRVARSRRSGSTWCAGPSRPGSTRPPHPRSPSKTVVGGVIDGHNIWRGDLEARLRHAHRAAVAQPRRRRLDLDLAAPRAARRRRRAGARRAAEDLARVRRPEGRTGRDARPRAGGRSRGDPGAAERRIRRARRPRLGARRARWRRCAPARPPSPTADFSRGDYADRLAAQDAALGLPFLPTTTIGSFPQTGDIRRARAQLAKGLIIDEAEYLGRMRDEIKRVVDLQEEIGIDVIVHGEPERNDMVQYFAENLDGFAVTQNGWVQSYGSPLYASVDPVGRRLAAEADHGRLVDLHAEPHREAGEGHADRSGHHPGLVVRARRPAARRDRPAGRAGAARRDRRPRGGRDPHRAGRRAGAARAAAAQEGGARRLPRLVGRLVPARDRRSARRDADPHPPLLLGVRRRHRRDPQPRRRRDEHRGGPLADGGRPRHPDAPASSTASGRASTTSTRRACRASPR